MGKGLVQASGPFYMRQLRLVCGKDEGEMKNDGCSTRSLVIRVAGVLSVVKDQRSSEERV